jgi:hypothetical protein
LSGSTNYFIKITNLISSFYIFQNAYKPFERDKCVMDSSSSNECVFVQITCSFPDLFINVHKNLTYLNHLLNVQINGMFCIETIHNGIIYIYKNLDLFFALNPCLSSKNVNAIKGMDRTGSAEFLIEILSAKNFPSEGLKIHFQIFANTEKDLAITLIKYFQSYKEPAIQATQISTMALDVRFNNFDALTLYTQRLGSLFEKVIKNGKIPTNQDNQIPNI